MTTEQRIPTNLRMLLILEAIGYLPSPVTPSDLARELGLTKQTIHRLCATLMQEGFLIRDDRKTGLRPARRMRQMAAGVLYASSSHLARHQVLQSLAEDVKETVNFVVPEDRGMTYQDRVETDWPFRIQLPVGTHVPFHCTASGKTYLASLPKAERTRLVHVMHLEKHTENTITDPKALLSELTLIAKQGYAVDREEFFDGMIAVAVPVYDPSGRYLAAVAFHAPSVRVSVEAALEARSRLLKASKDLTIALFYDVNG